MRSNPFDSTPDKEFCIQPAAIVDGGNEEDIAEARRLTHDSAIRIAGERRISGVTWIEHDSSHAVELIEQLLPAVDPTDKGAWESIAAFLKEHPEGLLVLASCEVQP